MRISFAKIVAALLLAFSASLCFAHTTATVSPKSGSVLTVSPPVIEIKFEHAANLTSVVLVEAGKPDRALEFSPKGSAQVFNVANPHLNSGRSEIKWKALSKDGHVVSGTVVLTVTPSAKAN